MTGAEASAIDQLRNDVRGGLKAVNDSIKDMASALDKHSDRIASLEQTRSNMEAVERDRVIRRISRREKLTAITGIVGFVIGVLSTLHSLGLY